MMILIFGEGSLKTIARLGSQINIKNTLIIIKKEVGLKIKIFNAFLIKKFFKVIQKSVSSVQIKRCCSSLRCYFWTLLNFGRNRNDLHKKSWTVCQWARVQLLSHEVKISKLSNEIKFYSEKKWLYHFQRQSNSKSLSWTAEIRIIYWTLSWAARSWKPS